VSANWGSRRYATAFTKEDADARLAQVGILGGSIISPHTRKYVRYARG